MRKQYFTSGELIFEGFKNSSCGVGGDDLSRFARKTTHVVTTFSDTFAEETWEGN